MASEAAEQGPRPGRPAIPGYGIEASAEGLLDWAWAEERLAACHNYWVATVNPNGAPHAVAVWGVWVSGRFWFSTGARTRKARNLAADGRCVVTTERADEAVVVEGLAELAAEVPPETPRAYEAKYGMGYPADSAVFSVRPGRVFGFIEEPSLFSATATKWEFDGA